MSQTKRRTRPVAERTAPDRKWSSGAHPSDSKNGAAASGAEASASETASSDPREAAYDAVNSAYRVIDEYLRQGQRIAEGVWLPLAGSVAEGNPFNAPERFLRAMGDMTMAWAEVMQQWTQGVQGSVDPAQGARAGTAGPFTAGQAPAPKANAEASRTVATDASRSGEVELAVSVESKGRVATSVHLQAGADPSRLLVGELRHFEGKEPSIRDVTLDSTDAEPITLRIKVPDDQPAGVYSALFVERETQRPRGTVSLTVLE